MRALRPLVVVIALAMAAQASVSAIGAKTSKSKKPAIPDRYLVQRGDSIPRIAAKFGITPAQLTEWNGLADGRLFYGAWLFLHSPNTSSRRPAVSGAGPTTWKVKKGQSWAYIAKKTGTTAKALAAANGKTTKSIIRPGQILQVNGASWRCPVAGHSTFVNDWGFPREGGRAHAGNDLMTARGTALVAVVGGTVTKYPNNLGGMAVQLVGNDGIRYYYAHLDRYGATGKVQAGAIIGYAGSSGDAAGGPSHLHFEVHPAGGAAVNPFPYISQVCR